MSMYKKRIEIQDGHFIRNGYSPRQKVQLTFPTDSPFTKQSFKDECDINRIMARYQATGILPQTAEKIPQYLDTDGYDFQEMQNYVTDARSMFMELPSSLRARFANDPAQFLNFCSDESNRSELEALGFLKPRDQWATPSEKTQPAPSQVPSSTSLQTGEPATPAQK